MLSLTERKGTTMLPTLARNWWAIVLRGVFAVFFGLGAFFWPGITLAVLVLLYGAYLFADGILAVLWALAGRRAGALAVLWLIGAFALVAGIVMIALGLRLKGMKDAATRRPAYGR